MAILRSWCSPNFFEFRLILREQIYGGRFGFERVSDYSANAIQDVCEFYGPAKSSACLTNDLGIVVWITV